MTDTGRTGRRGRAGRPAGTPDPLVDPRADPRLVAGAVDSRRGRPIVIEPAGRPGRSEPGVPGPGCSTNAIVRGRTSPGSPTPGDGLVVIDGEPVSVRLDHFGSVMGVIRDVTDTAGRRGTPSSSCQRTPRRTRRPPARPVARSSSTAGGSKSRSSQSVGRRFAIEHDEAARGRPTAGHRGPCHHPGRGRERLGRPW